MPKLNEHYQDLKESYLFAEIAHRVAAYEAEHPDSKIIRLGIGDVTLPLGDLAIKGLHEGVDAMASAETFKGYGPEQGYGFLRDAISAYYARNGVSVDAADIFISDGAKSDTGNISELFDNDNVILIPDPVYPVYVDSNIMNGKKVTYLSGNAENNFLPMPDPSVHADIIYLCSPNNPTGAIMEREDLEKIAEIILEKDLFVISDEIYSELTYAKEDHVSIASLPGMKERTVLINGFSKAFAMTGWRLGYACAPEVILKQMLKIHQYAIMCAPTTSQYAAVEALRNGDEDVQHMRESYDQRRRFLINAFEEMHLDCFEPQGAFYMFPSIKRFGMTSEEFATRLLREEKVAVVPGTAFGDCGEGFLRVSYAYSLKSLKEALSRIKRFVDRLDGKTE